VLHRRGKAPVHFETPPQKEEGILRLWEKFRALLQKETTPMQRKGKECRDHVGVAPPKEKGSLIRDGSSHPEPKGERRTKKEGQWRGAVPLPPKK